MIHERDGRLELRCDAALECTAIYSRANEGRRPGSELLRRAYGAGWRTDARGDVCPACAQRPETDEQADNREHAAKRAAWLAGAPALPRVEGAEVGSRPIYVKRGG